MIVDDFIEYGLLKAFDDKDISKYHIVKVPYIIGNVVGSNNPYLDPLVSKLCPVKECEKTNGMPTQILDATWGRLPYDKLIICSSSRECNSIIVVDKLEGVGGSEVWLGMLFNYTKRGLTGWPILVYIDKENLELAPVANLFDEEDKTFYYYNMIHSTVSSLHNKECADTYLQDVKDLLEEQRIIFNISIEQMMMSFMIYAVKPVLCTTSLMNAKNITCVSNKPDEKLQKARMKRGKQQLVTWHELKLTPFKKMHKEGGSSKVGDLIPLHWVRGHFKIFSKEKPLFGRFSGRFWWQPHIAGTDDSRFVKKSYKIDV